MGKWFLLYDGSSADGRGPGRYYGRTTSAKKAKQHFEEVYNDPYSTGYVMIISDKKEERAGWLTDWDALISEEEKL